MTAPLVAIMTLQGETLPKNNVVLEIKSKVLTEKAKLMKEKVESIEKSSSWQRQRSIKSSQEKGASSWLGVLPLAEQGFNLNKGEFRDAIAMRYNLPIKGLPSVCPCGQKFNVTHAMNCKKGGFVIMRHNNLRDFEANLVKKVCTDVEIEPPLQPLQGESLENGENSSEAARLDVRARGFWRRGQFAF